MKSQRSTTAPSKDKAEDGVAQVTVKLRQPKPYIHQPKSSQKETVEVKSQVRGWSASTNLPVKVEFEECDVEYEGSLEKRSYLRHILNFPPSDIPQLPLKSGGPNTRPNSSLARTLQNIKIQDTIKE